MTVASCAVTDFAFDKSIVWVLARTSLASATMSISARDLFDEPSTSSACCMFSELRLSPEAML